MNVEQITLNQAILDWMAEHGITRGEDCPILKISLAGYAADGTPLIRVRQALDHEVQAATGGGTGGSEKVEELNGTKLLTLQTDSTDAKLLRDLSDKSISKLGSGVALIVGTGDGKVSLIVRGEHQRNRFQTLPALSLVPEARAPPKGCCPTTAPVGLSLI